MDSPDQARTAVAVLTPLVHAWDLGLDAAATPVDRLVALAGRNP